MNNVSSRKRNSRRHPSRATKRDMVPLSSVVDQLKMTNRLLANQNTKELPNSPDIQWTVPSENKIHTFTTSYYFGQLASSTSIEIDGSISFNLNSSGIATSLASLFDCYRIRRAKVLFEPLANQNSSTGGASASLITALDHDDATSLTSTSLLSYSSVQVAPAGTVVERVLTPNAANPVYSGSGFTYFARVPNSQWIDLANPATPYYGVKYTLGNTATATTIYNIYVHLVVECKNIR